LLPLQAINLDALMARTYGSPEIAIGLVDGPVAREHPGLANEHIRNVRGVKRSTCVYADSMACGHATFIAGILSGKRGSVAPAICPNCTLLLRPVFEERSFNREKMPTATPLALAAAIVECIDEGARVVNLSLAVAQSFMTGAEALQRALDYALKQDVIIVAAAGNCGSFGSSIITSHQWVIPVAACNAFGRPMVGSNLGRSLGSRGLSAPGESVISLGAGGESLVLDGTSVAAPFVTGAIALLWSEFPTASAADVKLAAIRSATPRRLSVVPPLLNAEAGYRMLSAQMRSRSA
jgi:subtilisin family serine protease